MRFNLIPGYRWVGDADMGYYVGFQKQVQVPETFASSMAGVWPWKYAVWTPVVGTMIKHDIRPNSKDISPKVYPYDM